MATDAWSQARDAVVGLWRRFRPERVPMVEEDLDELRRDVLAAREQGDTPTQDALAAEWQQRLSEVLRRRPELAEELRTALDDVLAPALEEDERAAVYRQTNIARDHGRAFGVQRGNLIYHEAGPSAESRQESDD
ncbi:hypothetical protein [Streptomyces sp. JJ38]|uniref:hypothetical protein n=1 Tax=Streptomyces sp. JJ38 TaxID=2738128 RepID=UPI001C5989BB|nr:hypothetical protein [Streptomyces sp. JJ38]MBW1595651.1 hypothetical protein [Streptomyces sp. JJ38]